MPFKCSVGKKVFGNFDQTAERVWEIIKKELLS